MLGSGSNIRGLDNSDVTLPTGTWSRTPSAKGAGKTSSPEASIGSENMQQTTTTTTTTTSAAPVDDEPTWPRDWRAYTALMGSFFLMFNSWGLVNAFGTFASYYKEHLMPGRDLLMMNLIGSTESFIVLILSGVVGRLLDAGFSRIILPVGAALVTIGMFTLSITSGDGSYNQGKYSNIWVTQGLTTGLGMACFFVASSQIASTWFVKRRSFAIGIVASGASIAGLVYPFMIKYLIASLGWIRAVQATAGLTTATAIISAVFAVPNPAHPLNNDKTNPWTSIRRWVDPPAFKNATYNWFCASIALMFFGFYAVFFNLEEWALNEGLGKSSRAPVQLGDTDAKTQQDADALQTFIYLSVMNGASTLGRLSSGYLSDHYGALNVHFVVMLVSSLLLLLLWTLAKTVSAALAFVVVFGAFSGAVIGMPPATIANIIHHSPEADHSRMGHWTGMMYTLAAPFALVGPVIAGHLITKYKTFLTVQLWSGICLFLSSICIGMAILCMRRKDRHNEEGRVRRIRAWGSRTFDMEGGSMFTKSGRATAAGTRDVSEDEKEEEK